MNLDRFRKPYSLNAKVVDTSKFNSNMMNSIFNHAFEMEKKLKTEPKSALDNCRLAVEEIAIAATSRLPQDVMIGYIKENFKERYLNGTYNPNFSNELMKAAKKEKTLKDWSVIDKMYDLYHFCSSNSSHSSAPAISDKDSSDLSDNSSLTFSAVLECFEKLYDILSSITGQQVPPVDTDAMPINGYSITKKYNPSAYGDETKVYLAKNNTDATAIIYEYNKEAEKTNKVQKVEDGSVLSNDMRSAEVRSLLNAISVNQNGNYGISYYMIYNTSSVDERLDKAIIKWRKNGEDDLENALKIGSCLLNTLYALKRNKIHHRNICPENIFVSYKDMFAQLTNIGMVKFDKTVGESLNKISQESDKTLGINDYGINYFTKNRYTPKGMRHIYFDGISLQNINWELVDIYSVIKVISACYSEDSLTDQIEYADNEAAMEIFRIAQTIDGFTGEQIQKDYKSGFSVEKLQELVEDALDQC